MDKVKIITLDSGIKVIMERMDNVKSASFGVWVKAGAINESHSVSGISHYIEHMMFKGTTNRTYTKIASDIDKIGGQINAFTGKEATCYYVKTMGESLLKGADVIIDMIEHSIFDVKEMNKERKVIIEEINMTLDTPDDLCNDAFNEVLYKGNSYGKSIIGSKSSLKSINRDDIVEYINKEYTRDSIIVSVAGNFDEGEVIKFLESKFLSLKKSKQQFVPTISEYKPSFKSIQKDIAQTHICLGVKALILGDPRFYSFTLLNNILGGSMSSRLFQNIREEKGLCYSIFSLSTSYIYDGNFMIYTGVNSDKIELAIKGIKDELNIIKDNGVTSEELNMAKEQMKSTYFFGQENVATRMFVNGKNLLRENKYYNADEILEGINSVTLKDIDNVKELIVDLSKYSGTTVSNNKIDLKGLWNS